jgi:hypothetical protein
MRTMRDLIQEMLCSRGLQEAASVEVKTKDGLTFTIHSDNHPALDRSAEEVVSATPRQTAQGGF